MSNLRQVVTVSLGVLTLSVLVACSSKTPTPPPAPSEFDIEVRFNGPDFTPARQQVFRDAAARWAEIITGDLPDLPIDKADNACGLGEPALNATVDDLVIDAFIEPIDGVGGLVGQAGPCFVRLSDATMLPAYGTMRFDTADIVEYEADGRFTAVILHEMGHVLGIGTRWDALSHLDYATDPAGQVCDQATLFSTPPSFNGAAATAEFNALGGSGQPPVEDEFGPGTKCVHWDEAFFGTELMTGLIGAGTSNPLSRLTAGSLGDLGYTVDLSTAEPYTIPACSPSCPLLQTTGEAHAIEEDLLSPKFGVGEDGTLTRLEDGRRD